MDGPGDSGAPFDRRADVTGGQGFQVGDNNTQYNLFVGPQPPWPVVAGNVPLEPPAFQPRDDLMAKLRAAGPGVSVVRAMTGMRGVGKTQVLGPEHPSTAMVRQNLARAWQEAEGRG